jgi:hypothetical protein
VIFELPHQIPTDDLPLFPESFIRLELRLIDDSGSERATIRQESREISFLDLIVKRNGIIRSDEIEREGIDRNEQRAGELVAEEAIQQDGWLTVQGSQQDGNGRKTPRCANLDASNFGIVFFMKSVPLRPGPYQYDLY